MLRIDTIKSTTFELLLLLMQDRLLADFVLVGGTALALQIGHRDSIDLDLFSRNSFDESNLFIHLEKTYGFQQDFLDRNTLKGEINGVKVDFMTHAYINVQDAIIVQNIRMASLPDIAAMKLNAIIGNGTRIKDFIDVAYLSLILSLYDMQEAYHHKYPTSNPIMVPKALSFYEDINFKEPIKMTQGGLKWSLIQKRLLSMINNPTKVFPPLNM